MSLGLWFNIRDYLQWMLFIYVNLAIISNIFFAHQYATGKVTEILFFFSVSISISNITGYVLFTLIKAGFDFAIIDWVGCLIDVLKLDPMFFGLALVIFFGFVFFYVSVFDRRILNFSGSGGLRTHGDLKQLNSSNLENSRWMNETERHSNFKYHKYSELAECKKDGIPVAAKVIGKNKDMEVAFNSPCHSIIIGSTGSGKTTTFVSPMIQLLGATAAGSSMIVTDPKGELFSLHSKYLQSRGYDVKVVDLRDTYSSYKWNPLDGIWEMNEKYLKAHTLAKRFKGPVSEETKKMDPADTFNDEDYHYEFEGGAYSNYDHLVSAIKMYKKKLFDEIYEDLNDLVSVLIPVENEKDPMWEKGARSIALAVLLAMLEDAGNEKLNMTKSKFTFFNLAKILQNSSNDYEDLRNYFKGRSPLSKALALSKQVCDAATQTRASYMSIVYEKLTLFNDAGICALTSSSDFTAEGLAERPTALFLKIPDEKDTRHNLAAIFILNIYKTLIKVASATEELTLPRNVYFIMDEFGNMPKIEKFDKFITVGRSRKIWFTMIIQSYAQLNNVYGETVADIVKGNCGIKMFIGSNDMGTCKEYSELCGNITVVTSSTSSSGAGKDVNVSQQTQVRPLIYPSELQRLNHAGDIGHSIIVTFGNFPLKTYFTPSFKVPFYQIGKMDTSDTQENFFDENANFYNVKMRNNLLLKPNDDAKQTEKKEIKELKLAETPKKKEEKTEENLFNDETLVAYFRIWQRSNPMGTMSEFFDAMANRAQEKDVISSYNDWKKNNPDGNSDNFFTEMAEKKKAAKTRKKASDVKTTEEPTTEKKSSTKKTTAKKTAENKTVEKKVVDDISEMISDDSESEETSGENNE